MLKPLTLCTDASGVHLGAVLSQEDHNGLDRPVAHYSRGLTTAERNDSTIELECLAVVAAVKHSAYYLKIVYHLKVITDHRSILLEVLKSLQDLRWALTLQPFVVGVIHRAGSMYGNVDVDGLSRMISTPEMWKEEGKNVVNNV